jgi:hypothetical protein
MTKLKVQMKLLLQDFKLIWAKGEEEHSKTQEGPEKRLVEIFSGAH